MTQLEKNTQVILLAPEPMVRNYKWYDDADKIDPRLQLLSPEYVDSESFPCSISKENGLVEGMMFARNPFDKDSFVEISNLEDIVLQTKLHLMESIGCRLGAKAIHIKCIRTDSEKRTVGVDVDSEFFKVVNLGVNVDKENHKLSSGGYEINDDNPESVLTLESWEEALNDAKKYGIYSIPVINILFLDRDPRKPNLYKGCRKIKISGSKETNDKLDIAVKASYLKKFSLDVKVATTCVIEHTIDLEVEFDFREN